MDLRAAFLARAGGAAAGGEPAALESALASVVQGVRERWPDLPIPAQEFVGYIAERLPSDGDPLAALRALHVGDLYLACGCARGEAWALAAFERDQLSQVDLFIAKAHPGAGFAEEVKQQLRARLLVREGGAAPRIAGYSGQGPLGGWLRISASRAAIDLRRAQKDGPLEARPLAEAATVTDPELAYLKKHYRGALEEALRATLASLSPREGNILRLHFFEGLAGPAIATLYRVTDRTARRWIVEARDRILKETRARLGERLEMSASQLDTLMGLVQSQIDLSIGAYFERSKPGE